MFVIKTTQLPQSLTCDVMSKHEKQVN